MAVSLTSDYFELFDLDPEFTVPAEVLANRFRDLQKIYHPDKFVNEDPQTRREAVQLAAHINAGFETLKDPLARGAYLLEQQGVVAGEDSQTSSDMEFLMQQMALRERLEEIPDAVEPLIEADVLKKELNASANELCERFGSLYEAGDFAAAREILSNMKFFRRLLDSLSDLEAKLEDELF